MATGWWTGARALVLAIAALGVCAALATGCGGSSLGKTTPDGGARDMRTTGTGGTGGKPGGGRDRHLHPR